MAWEAVLGSSRSVTCRGGAGEGSMGGSAGFEPRRHSGRPPTEVLALRGGLLRRVDDDDEGVVGSLHLHLALTRVRDPIAIT